MFKFIQWFAFVIVVEATVYADEFPDVVKVDRPKFEYRAILFSRASCEPCERMKLGIKTDLVPKGWRVGRGEHIEYVDADTGVGREFFDSTDDSVPQVVVLRNNQVVARYYGFSRAPRLAQWLNACGEWK